MRGRVVIAVLVIAGLLVALRAVLVWKAREDALDRALDRELSDEATTREKWQTASSGLGALGGIANAVGGVFSFLGKTAGGVVRK